MNAATMLDYMANTKKTTGKKFSFDAEEGVEQILKQIKESPIAISKFVNKCISANWRQALNEMTHEIQNLEIQIEPSQGKNNKGNKQSGQG